MDSIFQSAYKIIAMHLESVHVITKAYVIKKALCNEFRQTIFLDYIKTLSSVIRDIKEIQIHSATAI